MNARERQRAVLMQRIVKIFEGVDSITVGQVLADLTALWVWNDSTLSRMQREGLISLQASTTLKLVQHLEKQEKVS